METTACATDRLRHLSKHKRICVVRHFSEVTCRRVFQALNSSKTEMNHFFLRVVWCLTLFAGGVGRRPADVRQTPEETTGH